jgi:hypothetical protein
MSNGLLQQVCGDIEQGTVAVICECGKIRQHGRPCGYTDSRRKFGIVVGKGGAGGTTPQREGT